MGSYDKKLPETTTSKDKYDYTPKLGKNESFYRGDGGFSPAITIFDKNTGKIIRTQNVNAYGKPYDLPPETDPFTGKPLEAGWIL